MTVDPLAGGGVNPNPTEDRQCAGWDQCKEPTIIEVNGKRYCATHNPWHNGGPDDPCPHCCRSKPLLDGHQ